MAYFRFQVLIKNRECPEFLIKVEMIKKQVQDLSMHIKICFQKKKEKDRALSAKEEKMKRKKERLDRERQKWKAEKAEQRKRDMEEARRRQSVNAYKKQESNSLGDPFGNHGDENASTLQDDSNDIR